MYAVVLASGSPRREELLRKLVPNFEVVPAEIDEDALTDPDPWITAQRLAREKALAVREVRPDCLVIGGDTVVALAEGDGWRQLSKPVDRDDAVRMLSALSGRTHKVVTGVCLVAPSGMSAFTETTEVTFRKLGKEEIAAYVATGAPMDKAGAYGLQDASQDFVAQVAGSVTNVIGLPMEKLKEEIRRFKLLE
ncbi:MAG: septum formation protein Maf [Fimbriimonadaceae bacterium]|nr:septum formation protein Maf [Fimbriimonadaceae bacterium]QYK57940.1 MAG: septum formation protein Maf [Fimbriimonadaceae bacterium]